MQKAAPRSSTRGRGPCALFAAAVAFLVAVSPAHAYVNPRLLGGTPWVPTSVRDPGRLGSLQPVVREGRLAGVDRKVREEYDIDLETGRITIRQVYGKTLVAPEWVEDIDTAIRTIGRTTAVTEWNDNLSKRTIQGVRSEDQSVVTIDIPVEFPDAVADVIGQGARLNLTGSERITFTGTSNKIEGGQVFESQTSSGFPDLDMRQQLRVNLDGTIGRKIHVLLNHDSEASTDLSNKIQLRYDGDEDEVVQKIEMGNTELSLPGADFLSFRKSQQGLFGAKAVGKFGPMDLGVIASKQEGQTARQSFVGQARSDSIVIRDVEYLKRKYFFIDIPEALVDSTGGILPTVSLEVFLDDQIFENNRDLLAIRGYAYTDARAGQAADSSSAKQKGWYHPLRLNVDYTFRPEAGIITLEQPLAFDHALACYFVRADGDSVGNFSAGVDSTVSPPAAALGMQLLAPPLSELWDDTKGFVPLRDLEIKNTYSLGAKNLVPGSLHVKIRRRASSAGEQDLDKQQSSPNPLDNVEYVRILGLDNRGVTAGTPPDSEVDDEFVDEEEGLLVFRNLTPFAPDSSTVNYRLGPDSASTGRSTEPGPKLIDYNGAIYSQRPDQILSQWEYEISATYTTPTPTYSLNRFNILEGSERVRLNGRLLNRGADYDIDYELGILTFKTPDANLPDVKIEVDFEFVPLFGQAKESLAGISGTYNFDPLTRLSSTWLYYSKATPELRPRLGQEPSRIMVGDLFGQWQKNPTIMTSLVNAVPFVTSEEQSELNLQGEAAMSLPNPNTKDEIYIDDMEGVEDSRDLTITRALWLPASEPIGPVTADLALDRRQVPRYPFNWYNPDNVVRRKEVFPELAGQQEGEDFLQVLEFAVRDSAGAEDPARWMGVMRNLSPTGDDFSQKKFLEIWVNDFQNRQGKVIFDMGEVSEDFYLRTGVLPNKGRGFLDTEDTDPIGGDGILNKPREDLGLDNVGGEDGTNQAGDDGDDDFDFERTQNPDYTRINNTEDNNFLDTEDLDGDRSLDLDNTYFSYVLDLADSVVVDGLLVPNPAVVQDNGEIIPGNGWRLFQIPLDDGITVTEGALPRRLSVKYARLWFDGLPTGPGAKVQIASLKIAGAAWQEEKFSRNDTVEAVDEPTTALFTIKDVNNKEDPVYAGQEPFDPGEDSNQLKRREQSLVVDYRGIPSSAVTPGGAGRQGSAYREILDTGGGKNQDFTQYEDLSFFLRDGQRLTHKTDRPDTSQGTFFFRFGPDTTNFYEFSTKMGPKWGEWHEVRLRLNDLAELKLDPAESTRTVEGVPVPYRRQVMDGDTLAVYGAPSLTRVRRMTVGVRGDDPLLPEATVSGVIWFDEVRLKSVKKEPGYASRANGSARFADFATVNGSVRKVDSEFRGIDGDRLGDDQLAWNVRGDMQMHKFVDGRGLSLPFSASYSDSRSIPRLAPNSDIELEDPADRTAAQSRTRQWDVSGRFAKVRPSSKPWVRYTIDNFALSASNRHEKSYSPYQLTKGEGSTALATYNLNPGTGKTFKVLQRFDISYFPTLKLAMNGNVNILNQADILQDSTGVGVLVPRLPVRTRTLKASVGTVWDPIRSNSFDSQVTFNKVQDLDLNKNVALWESFKDGGREEARDHSGRLSWHPTRVRWLRPVFTYTSRYAEDAGQSAQDPNTPARLRSVANGSTREVSATLSLRQLLPRKGDSPPKRAARRPTEGRTGPPPTGDEDTPREPDPRDATPEEGEAPPDSAQGEHKGPPKLPSLGTIGSKLLGLVSAFGDIRGSYRDSRDSRFGRLGARPSWGYQMGISPLDRSEVIPGTQGVVEDRSSNSWESKIDTTFQPTSSLFLDASYARTVTRSEQNQARNKTEDVAFPDISMSLDGLERHLFLKKMAKTSALNSAYRQQTRYSGKLPPTGQVETGPWYDTKSEREEFAPLISWNTSWNSGINTTLSYNRSEETTQNLYLGESISTVTNRALRLNGRYSFSAPQGVSVLGKRIRFRSDMTLSLDIERILDKETSQTPIDPFPSARRDGRSISIKPRATYNFSKKVQGSLDLGYARTKDFVRDRSDRTITVAVEALIKF